MEVYEKLHTVLGSTLANLNGIIYIAVQTVEKRNGEPGETEKKFKPISWKRARQLELM